MRLKYDNTDRSYFYVGGYGLQGLFFFSPGNKYFFFSLKIHFVPYLAIKIAKVILTKGRTFFCGGRGQGGVNPS